MTKKFRSKFNDETGSETAICNKCGSDDVEIIVQSTTENDGLNDFEEVVSIYTCKDCGAVDSSAC